MARSELAVWVLDLESRALTCSDELVAMFGARPATQPEWLACVTETDRERLSAALSSSAPFDLDVGSVARAGANVRVRARRMDRTLVGTCELTEITLPVADTRLTANIVHELNNALAVVVGNLEFICESIGSRHGLDEIVSDAQAAMLRMQTILGELRPPRPSAPVAALPRDLSPSEATSRILVVDDEVLFTNAVSRLFRDLYDVSISNNTEEALARFETGQRFDAIVCDLMMPQIGGMGLYARVAELAPDQAQRFVFVTGGATTPAAQSFLDGLANPRLDKPCDFKELRAMVKRVASD